MEIKLPEAAPLWLAEMLSENRLFPAGFSKYGECYKANLINGGFSVFNSIITVPINLVQFLVWWRRRSCWACWRRACSRFRKMRHSGSFAVALALLPSVVAVVIMMVNGNVGAGLAVAGTFALVQRAGHRARDNGAFLCRGAGLSPAGWAMWRWRRCSFVIFSLALIVLTYTHFGENGGTRQLKITIPENPTGESFSTTLKSTRRAIMNWCA